MTPLSAVGCRLSAESSDDAEVVPHAVCATNGCLELKYFEQFPDSSLRVGSDCVGTKLRHKGPSWPLSSLLQNLVEEKVETALE